MSGDPSHLRDLRGRKGLQAGDQLVQTAAPDQPRRAGGGRGRCQVWGHGARLTGTWTVEKTSLYAVETRGHRGSSLGRRVTGVHVRRSFWLLW